MIRAHLILKMTDLYFPKKTYTQCAGKLNSFYKEYNIVFSDSDKKWIGVAIDIVGSFKGYNKPASFVVTGDSPLHKEFIDLCISFGAELKLVEVEDVRITKEKERLEHIKQEEERIKKAQGLQEQRNVALGDCITYKLINMERLKLSKSFMIKWIKLEHEVDIEPNYYLSGAYKSKYTNVSIELRWQIFVTWLESVQFYNNTYYEYATRNSIANTLCNQWEMYGNVLDKYSRELVLDTIDDMKLNGYLKVIPNVYDDSDELGVIFLKKPLKPKNYKQLYSEIFDIFVEEDDYAPISIKVKHAGGVVKGSHGQLKFDF